MTAYRLKDAQAIQDVKSSNTVEKGLLVDLLYRSTLGESLPVRGSCCALSHQQNFEDVVVDLGESDRKAFDFSL